jgi:hypothetical protein
MYVIQLKLEWNIDQWEFVVFVCLVPVAVAARHYGMEVDAADIGDRNTGQHAVWGLLLQT